MLELIRLVEATLVAALRMIEAGSHTELIARDGRYAELYTIQARAHR